MNPDPPDESPLEELQKRVAEAGGGLAAAAKAVGLENHRAMLAAHQKRVNRDDALMRLPFLQKLGVVPDNFAAQFASSGEDEMGDITVTGDIHIQQPPRNQKEQPMPPPPLPAAPPSQPGLGPVATSLIAAGVVLFTAGAGVLTGYLLRQPDQPAAVATTPDRDTTITVEGH